MMLPLSKMSAVYKSPVSEDVFVVFEDFSQLGWDGTEKPTTIGSLICVHADGTVADILKVRDSWNLYTNYMRDPTQITFDALGNLYFIACDYYDSNGNYINNAGQVIYKFEPSSDTLTTMVAEVDGTRYEKLQITNDGAWILVQGTRNNFSTYFLRAIPASNPNNFVNIFYSSTNSIQSDKWIYDDNSGLLCYVATDGNGQGLYTVSKRGGFSDKQFRGYNIGGSPYDWFKDFYDGNINAYTFLEKFANACPWDIEFRYAYSEWIQAEYVNGELVDGTGVSIEYSFTDIEALEKMKEREGESILSGLKSNSYPYTLLQYCYLKDTDICTNGYIIKNGSYQYYYNDFMRYETYDSAFSVKSTGIYAEFWPSTTNTLCLVHVADAQGNFIEETTRVELPSGKKIDSQKYGNQFVIKYALTDSNGGELGYQQLYSLDFDTGEVVNRFDNVANRNNLEVISYSVGADRLYFSAVRGTAVENHIVDLITNQTNPLGINRKMVAVYAF